MLDTSAIIAAMRSPCGASAALLRAVLSNKVTAVANVSLALEYEATCLLPEHRLAAGLNLEEARVFVDAIIALCEPVENAFLWRPQLRDPGDELVLEAAVNGRAEAIVTFNRRDFAPAAQRFGIEVWLPREALRSVRR